MRNGVTVALGYVLLFYLFTPVMYCWILRDEGVCPSSPDRPHTGWMTALYFASSTLSTVGYGDVTVDKTHKGHVVFTIFYMIIANVTLVGSFSEAARNTWHPLSTWHAKMMDRLLGEAERDEPMHKRLLRVYFFRLTELVGGYILLNVIGVFANRIFITRDTYPETKWHWLVRSVTSRLPACPMCTCSQWKNDNVLTSAIVLLAVHTGLFKPQRQLAMGKTAFTSFCFAVPDRSSFNPPPSFLTVIWTCQMNRSFFRSSTWSFRPTMPGSQYRALPVCEVN